MFSSIFKLIPKLSPADLQKMERNLQARFTKIAKKFGKGLATALAGGGIVGFALGAIDKLLNPLKEVQEAMDKIMGRGDDLVTNAKQFGTTAGKLAKLQAFGESTGLDAGSLDVLVNKFMGAVAEAQADPNKKSPVRAFVGEKDSAEAFFNFIQALQKMDKNQQLLVQQEVFGEKQVLKMADFLQTDFSDLNKFFKGISSDKLTKDAEKLGRLNDLTQTLGAVRGLKDLSAKAGVINEGMVKSKDKAEGLLLEKENARIKSYQSLSEISIASAKVQALVEKATLDVGEILAKLTTILGLAHKLFTLRGLKGFFSSGKGD